jgi:Asp-tRNA(Asn)/Glu-tRNA(Gln) amidotransferase A subunit family amidase
MTEPFELTATEAASRIDAGNLTAEALIASCIERIEAREDAVRAWKHFDPEAALTQARALDRGGNQGPIHGIPFGAKDIIDTSTMPTGHGSPIYEGHQPAIDAPCVALSLQSGGVLMGKTVSTEFASRHPGATRNPHNPAHTPGGSSSGSGAAVTDSMVPFAFGTQTGGSVIRPAAFCGCVGYKPTYGLISAAGVKENTRSFDTVGLYARTLDDITLFRAGVLAVEHTPLQNCSIKGLRIGFCRTMFWDRASQATQGVLEAAADKLARAGATVTDLTLEGPFEGYEALGKTVTGFEFPRALTFERTHHPEKLSHELFEGRLKTGLEIDFGTYQAALEQLAACRNWLADAFSGYDAILTPSAPDEAPEGLSYTGDPCFNILATWTYTPAVTLPTNTGPKGLPIGVQLVGPHGRDVNLLAMAKAAFPALSEGS